MGEKIEEKKSEDFDDIEVKTDDETDREDEDEDVGKSDSPKSPPPPMQPTTTAPPIIIPQCAFNPTSVYEGMYVFQKLLLEKTCFLFF